MKRKKDKKIRCFVYLSTDADEAMVEIKEKKQLRYIREYAKAHNIVVVKIFHKGEFGQNLTNRTWERMIERIFHKEAEGILLANMGTVAVSVSDAYYKIGKVIAAGGQVVTVDEGNLSLPIRKLGGIA
ncbi:MAG: resolvase [Clostridia bacterium]|nr:resolvase [Clostridia bacterium]NCC44965.1 resolvase [Clostridia bacterium]